MTDPVPDAPRRLRLTGLHHVTAISSDLARTTAFYRDMLGLTLVREARNDDDPDARQLRSIAGALARPSRVARQVCEP